MSKGLYEIMKNSAPFLMVQIKLNDDGVWFTLPNKDAKGEMVFRDLDAVEKYLKSENFQKWHPVEYRILDIKVMRYKKID